MKLGINLLYIVSCIVFVTIAILAMILQLHMLLVCTLAYGVVEAVRGQVQYSYRLEIVWKEGRVSILKLAKIYSEIRKQLSRIGRCVTV